MTTPVPTQADREIAAELHDEMGMHELAAQVRAGRMDNDTDVQRAMRHRLTAERETREACARIAIDQALVDEQMRNAARKEKDGHGALIHSAEAAAARSIAAAIRNTENTDDR